MFKHSEKLAEGQHPLSPPLSTLYDDGDLS